jgi:hypothetical protein
MNLKSSKKIELFFREIYSKIESELSPNPFLTENNENKKPVCG